MNKNSNRKKAFTLVETLIGVDRRYFGNDGSSYVREGSRKVPRSRGKYGA